MGTATGMAPKIVEQTLESAAVAAASSAEVPGFRAPFTGVVSTVNYIPVTTLTGADTQSRTLQVYNRGQAGTNTTLVAEKAFANGVNAAAEDETAITLAATAANLNVAEGDVLAFKSLAVGTTGLADPGGAVRIFFSRD